MSDSVMQWGVAQTPLSSTISQSLLKFVIHTYMYMTLFYTWKNRGLPRWSFWSSHGKWRSWAQIPVPWPQVPWPPNLWISGSLRTPSEAPWQCRVLLVLQRAREELGGWCWTHPHVTQAASLLYLQKQPHFLNQNLKCTATLHCPKQRCIPESGSESDHKLVGDRVHGPPAVVLHPTPLGSGCWGEGVRSPWIPLAILDVGFASCHHGFRKLGVRESSFLLTNTVISQMCCFWSYQPFPTRCVSFSAPNVVEWMIYRQTLKWIRGYSWGMCRASQGLSSATWPWVPTLLGLFWPQSPPHWTQRWGGE